MSIYGRGLCSPCYQLLRRHGRLDEYARTKKPFLEHLAGLDDRHPEACWALPLRPNGSGYVFTYYEGRHLGAHVASYLHHHGAVPEGAQVGHLCHDADLECVDGDACTHRRCVNPDHLAPMTPAENTQAAAHRLPRCSAGHAWTASNTRIVGNGRRCRRCAVERMRRVRATPEGRARHNELSRESYHRARR